MIPDYFKSLDAVYKALIPQLSDVETTTAYDGQVMSTRNAYIRFLCRICGDARLAMDANAAQRSEAFGKAMNLW